MDLENNWEAVRRATAVLCQVLWTDPGHGHCTNDHDLVSRIGEMRTAISRSAEICRPPPGAVVTLHGDLDKAASAWSERGSEWHRQQQAETAG